MRASVSKLLRVARLAACAAVAVVTAGSAAWVAEAKKPSPTAEPANAAKAEAVARVGADRVAVPAAVVARMGLTTAEVRVAHEPTKLPPFQGVLALDNDSMQRVHARFAGEVVELGTARDAGPAVDSSLPTPLRSHPVRVGDTVSAGQLLAVVWSKDLGEKKSELVDAVSKLKADELVQSRLRDLYKQGGTAERSLNDADRVVQADRVAIARVERTLKSWRLTDAEVRDLWAEAARLATPDSDAQKADAADWARVEVRATRAGTVLNKNVGVGDIVDTATDLFKLGDLTRLTVWAHVYEDDLPVFAALPKPVAWKVTLQSRPGVAYAGTLDQVGAIIDPGQHTALVAGTIANPEQDLKIGQFVTVTVERPADRGEFVVPSVAVVENGAESVVFVQPDPATCEFRRCPVRVLRRTRDGLFLRRDDGAAATLRAGDRVVLSGSLLLNEAMATLPNPAAAAAE